MTVKHQGDTIMTRRPAVTLIEVLVSMFIMAIGMLALLVLFPLGAVSMGQALKDDRCASTASMAENVAEAMNIRHDLNVVNGFNSLPGTPAVYVDYYGLTQGYTFVGANPAIPTANIPRVSLSFVTAPQIADRWFCLPDDITFLENGAPDLSTSSVQRGLRYSFAYLLTRPQPLQDKLVQLSVIVYSGRPTGALTLESSYNAAGIAGTNGVAVSWTAAQTAPAIKFGSWILDISPQPIPPGSVLANNPSFYRVVNITNSGPNSLELEVQPNLKANVTAIAVMDSVAEVFDKGTSWLP
jgi:hypothetical protein